MTSTAAPDTVVRGRPRQFDTDEVLDAVVELFWEKGYEATAMSDIVAATGLNKSSLYNAFGAKDDIYRAALGRYTDVKLAMLTAIVGEGPGGLASIEALFDMMTVEMHSAQGRQGCMAINGGTELGLETDFVIENSRRFREGLRTVLGAALDEAADRGELAPGAAEQRVDMLLTWMLGSAVAARSGASTDELDHLVSAARGLIDTWRA